MRPISYEIRRTLTSKFVILMIVAIIGLSSLLAYESAATYNSPTVPTNTPLLNSGYYFSGNNITIVTFSSNHYGDAYEGLHITVNSQSDIEYKATSDASGYANITVPYNTTSTSSITLNYSYSAFARSISSSKIPVNVRGTYSGYTLMAGLVSRTNTSNLGFQVMYVGNNGTSAPDTTVHVATYPPVESSQTVISNATYTENLSGFTVANVFPSIPTNIYNKTFAMVITSNGTVSPVTITPQYLSRLSTYSPMTQSRLQSLMFSGIGPILGFLLPILGVFAAYLTYGKDRTTGVLESVLKRPVTRHGLISSRFVANSVSIVIAVIVSMIFGDLIIEHYFSMSLTTRFSLYFIWTYVVEGLSFLAIIYMFSHVVKSQGALLGVSIAVFVVMALFWSIIPITVLAALRVSTTSSAYIMATVAFNYASPSGYSTLIQFFFTNKTGLLGTITANPAAYAVTAPLLMLAGILWIAVPFLIGYYLAGKYD